MVASPRFVNTSTIAFFHKQNQSAMETNFRLSSCCRYYLFIISGTLLIIPFALAATKDTLKQGDSLDFSTYLVSAKKTFTLGFFNLDKWWYLGIWYTADPDLSRVWVANRNAPIVHNTGSLTLDSSGKLKITSDGVDIFELYLHHLPTINASATLHDDGNFVLRELNADDGTEERVLWQSFDYPTDTLLPGMKLGINENTGKKWYLTSWLTDSDPSVGAFVLEWDPQRGSLLVKRRGELYWTSGVLKNKQFDFIDRENDAFSYEFINGSAAGEYYFMYVVTRGNYSKWVLDFEGIIYEHREEVELVYIDECYGFNTDGGCERWAVPGCRIDPSFIFGIPGPPPKENYQVYISETGNASLSDCRYECWKNCDCVGFNTIGSHATGCIYWSEKQMNYSVYSGSLDYGQFLTYATQRSSTGNGTNQTVQASEFKYHKPKGMGRNKRAWIAVSVLVSVLLLILAIFIGYLRAKLFKRDGNHEEKTDEYIHKLVSSDPHRTAYSHELQNEGRGHNLAVYSFEDIKIATDNFSPNNKLGEGGFGLVYKGELPGGREVAVKRLSEGSNQGIVEFRNELILIAELQHKNLVRLIGCCMHGEEKMLIYEYMHNKSLDYFLFDQSRSKVLDWPKRFNIIEGTAQGLLYLHKHSRLKVIHRDMKASNILLDQDMDPRISDFGMARIFTQNTHVGNTMRVVGTYGYMSPEYAMEGVFSEKSDVFSFGVMVLEIVSGQRNYSFYVEDCPLNLVGYAWELWNNGGALELLDCTMKDSCLGQYMEQVLRCIQVGLLCVQDSAAARPYMSEVILMLSNENATLPVPEKPAYVTGRNNINMQPGNVNLMYIGMSDTVCNSVNGLSVSVSKPR